MGIKFGYYLFIKNVLLNFLLVLQISALIISGNILIATFNNDFYFYELTHNIKDNTYLYMPDDLIEYENNKREKLLPKIQNIKAEQMKVGAVINENDYFVVLSVGTNMKSFFYDNFLKSGNLFSDSDNSDEKIECVIISNESKYNISDNILGRCNCGTCQHSLIFDVVGIADKNIYLPVFEKISNEATVDMIFSQLNFD